MLTVHFNALLNDISTEAVVCYTFLKNYFYFFVKFLIVDAFFILKNSSKDNIKKKTVFNHKC